MRNFTFVLAALILGILVVVQTYRGIFSIKSPLTTPSESSAFQFNSVKTSALKVNGNNTKYTEVFNAPINGLHSPMSNVSMDFKTVDLNMKAPINHNPNEMLKTTAVNQAENLKNAFENVLLLKMTR